MQPNDFQPCVIGLPADFASLVGRNIVRVDVDRKGRDLQARVAELRGKRKRLFERPILKSLVANGKTHKNTATKEDANLRRLIYASGRNSPMLAVKP